MIDDLTSIWPITPENILPVGLAISVVSMFARVLLAAVLTARRYDIPVIPFTPVGYFKQGSAFRQAARQGSKTGHIGSIMWTMDVIWGCSFLFTFALWMAPAFISNV